MSSTRVLFACLLAGLRRGGPRFGAGFGFPQSFAFCRSLFELSQFLLLSFFLGAALLRAFLPVIRSKGHRGFFFLATSAIGGQCVSRENNTSRNRRTGMLQSASYSAKGERPCRNWKSSARRNRLLCAPRAWRSRKRACPTSSRWRGRIRRRWIAFILSDAFR